MIDQSIINAINETKELSSPPAWSVSGAHQYTRLAVDVRGLGVQGLFVRIKIPQTIDAMGSMVQLEWTRSGNRVVVLERMDWKVSHTNTNRGPRDLRMLHIPSTHFHSFSLNFFEPEKRMLAKNMPVAEPIEPDPPSLQEFLAVCEKMLKIIGLALIERPPFQPDLLP